MNLLIIEVEEYGDRRESMSCFVCVILALGFARWHCERIVCFVQLQHVYGQGSFRWREGETESQKDSTTGQKPTT
jgi:hypothetical protein